MKFVTALPSKAAAAAVTPVKKTPARTVPAAPVITAAMQADIIMCAVENARMNAAKKKYDAVRARLLGAMNAAGVTAVDLKKSDLLRDVAPEVAKLLPDGVTLEAEIETPVTEKMDVVKLRGATTDAIFMKCITAAKGTVEKEAGAAVVAQVAVSTPGKANVSVSEKKVDLAG